MIHYIYKYNANSSEGKKQIELKPVANRAKMRAPNSITPPTVTNTCIVEWLLLIFMAVEQKHLNNTTT